jgi:hypothetical protein
VIVRHMEFFLTHALANRWCNLSRSAVTERIRQGGTRGVLKATVGQRQSGHPSLSFKRRRPVICTVLEA